MRITNVHVSSKRTEHIKIEKKNIDSFISIGCDYDVSFDESETEKDVKKGTDYAYSLANEAIDNQLVEFVNSLFPPKEEEEKSDEEDNKKEVDKKN